jgi:hypothetical protein
MASNNTYARLEAAHAEMRRLRRRQQRSNWLTAIVGILLLVLIGGYFSYGYATISEFRDDPDMIIAPLGNMADDQVRNLRASLETQVKENADLWAEQASQQVIAGMPGARKWLEDYACQQADSVIQKVDVIGDKQFRDWITENRDTVEKAVGQLKEGGALSDDVVALLEQELKEKLNLDVTEQAAVLPVLLSDLNKVLEGKDLNAEQQLERRILKIVRRLQKDKIGEVRLDQLAPAALTETVMELENARLQGEAAAAPIAPSAPAAGVTSRPAGEQPPKEEGADAASPPEAKEATDPPAAAVEAGPPAPEKTDEPKPAESASPEPAPAESTPAESNAAPAEAQ